MTGREEIIIRLAVIPDIPDIMRFIKENWKADHIFANDREFFEYMFVDGEEVHYVVARGEESNIIYGCVGFVKYNSMDMPDVSGMMLRVLKSPNVFLGVEVNDAILYFNNPRFSFGLGMNTKTSGKIERLRGIESGKMVHYYRLCDRPEYKIAKILYKSILPVSKSGRKLLPVHSFLEFDAAVDDKYLHQKTPYKDKKYLKHRYFEHPIYIYDCLAIADDDEKTGSVIITRTIEHENARVLRIIDFLGRDEDLSGIGYALDDIMKRNQYEYADCYCVGLGEEIMKKAGFIRRTEEDTNIIPNYFEPFEQKNVDIYYSVGKGENIYLFKGDSDQDRPNYRR